MTTQAFYRLMCLEADSQTLFLSQLTGQIALKAIRRILCSCLSSFLMSSIFSHLQVTLSCEMNFARGSYLVLLSKDRHSYNFYSEDPYQSEEKSCALTFCPPESSGLHLERQNAY